MTNWARLMGAAMGDVAGSLEAGMFLGALVGGVFGYFGNMKANETIIQQGRALVRAIEALGVIEPSGWFERTIARLLQAAVAGNRASRPGVGD